MKIQFLMKQNPMSIKNGLDVISKDKQMLSMLPDALKMGMKSMIK